MRRLGVVPVLALACAVVVALCCVTVTNAGAAMSAPPSVSAATVFTYISDYMVSQTGSTTPGTITMNNSSGNATASAYWSDGAGYAALSATALAGSQFNLSAQVEYYFEVSNPNQSYPMPLNVSLTAAGSALQTGNAGASGYIGWAPVPFGFGNGGTAFTVNSGGSSSFSGTATLPIYANVEYDIILHANSTAGGQNGAGTWVAGSASVLIDPMLTISQADIDAGYTLTISPDLSPGLPTPAPCTMLLLGPGLVGLAAIRRRFKK